MKKYILSENQIKKIIHDIINEQSEEQKNTKAVQLFLNEKLGLNLIVDGIAGEKTKEAIRIYQKSINVYPVDGIWGPETIKEMSIDDKKLYNNKVIETGDLYDRIISGIKKITK
jgi:peptidoglycan hydrolase-like protein with peptidoglycan-binding domain